MTDKPRNSIISNTQAADILDCLIGHKDFRKVAELLQSLPMVDSEPVAHMYPWDLERFATNETTGHAYSVAVGCADGESVPLYTSPQALTTITADDVTDEMVEAYLTAQRATVEEADRSWGRAPVAGFTLTQSKPLVVLD